MKKQLKNIFLTGLAVTVPIGLTIYVLFFLVDLMDSLLYLIPEPYAPHHWLPVHIPGLGMVVTVVLIFVAGLVTKSLVGHRLVLFGESLVSRIPIVRSIYGAIKRVSDGMFRDMSKSFKRVALVQFPDKSSYTVAFVTGEPNGEIASAIGRKTVSVYVPTTPNPTSGYFVMYPEEDLVYLDMTVEEAFTLIISVGMVNPKERRKNSIQQLPEKS
ncbi:MAG: hypothetical protein A4E73_00603 [Syntrophaceae bacterium PtaU1.Bin231]|nr:MAG: hypothetical protein A4E73_00603 [Syntrophaceae bacterium PtaU1.Bin231]